MNKETQELLSKLLSLSHEVSCSTGNHVFLSYSPHTMQVDIKWYVGEWRRDKISFVVEGANINGTIYLDDKKLLRKAVKTLEDLLK